MDESGTIAQEIMPNTLYYGDNLSVLRNRRWFPEGMPVADLIYLDPPFNSKEDYNACFKAEAQRDAFKDFWDWDDAAEDAYRELTDPKRTVEGVSESLSDFIKALHRFFGRERRDDMAYFAMMAIRLVELRKLLRPTGSLYLHCDPTASHYLKIILDAIFGQECFCGEIVWQRTNSRSTTGRWPRVHDSLLYYTREIGGGTFVAKQVPADPRKMPHTLITGQDGLKYQSYELTAPSISNGITGKPWRGFNPTTLGRGRHWANDPKTMDEWDKQRLIHWPKPTKKSPNPWPRRRDEHPFEPESRVVTVGDVWTDIDRLNQTAKERTPYPTQKPRALLERIIEASSNPGDLVLDPFCGCGTAIEAAHVLGREWIGIDVAPVAVDVIRTRMQKIDVEIAVRGWPTNLEGARKLAHDDPKTDGGFEQWVRFKLNARRVRKKDAGSDGELFFKVSDAGDVCRAIVSIKGGQSLNPAMVQQLFGAVTTHGAHAGILIAAYEPTDGMYDTARDYGYIRSTIPGDDEEYRKIQILTVEEILRGEMPKLPGRNATPKSEPPRADPAQRQIPFGPIKAKPAKPPPATKKSEAK